jgi:hypothetical protein
VIPDDRAEPLPVLLNGAERSLDALVGDPQAAADLRQGQAGGPQLLDETPPFQIRLAARDHWTTGVSPGLGGQKLDR